MSFTSQPEYPRTITIPEEMHALLCRSLPGFMEASGESWEETVHRLTMTGLLAALRQANEALERRAEVSRREEDIQAAIKNLTLELPVSNDELDLVLFASRNGHVDAAIIVEDFKRFGRSMNRGKGGAA